MAKKQNVYYGTGRRKSSIAKVRLVSGTGKITVNGKDVHEYLPYETLIMNLTQPLDLTNTREIFDVEVEVCVCCCGFDCFLCAACALCGVTSKAPFSL